MGYDDLPVAQWIGPALTTVRQPLVEMAGQATRLVLSLARGEHPPNTRIDLATTLIVRQSTAPIGTGHGVRSPDRIEAGGRPQAG